MDSERFDYTEPKSGAADSTARDTKRGAIEVVELPVEDIARKLLAVLILHLAAENRLRFRAQHLIAGEFTIERACLRHGSLPKLEVSNQIRACSTIPIMEQCVSQIT